MDTSDTNFSKVVAFLKEMGWKKLEDEKLPRSYRSMTNQHYTTPIVHRRPYYVSPNGEHKVAISLTKVIFMQNFGSFTDQMRSRKSLEINMLPSIQKFVSTITSPQMTIPSVHDSFSENNATLIRNGQARRKL